MNKKRISATPAEKIALSVYVKLMRAVESFTARAHTHIAEAGLTISQFGVLEALYHLGPLTQGEIGRKILRTGGNMTMVIDNLEKNGLVARERNTDDRRFFTIKMTPAGEKLISKIFPVHAKRIAEEMSVLSEEEQELLGELCKKLGRSGDK